MKKLRFTMEVLLLLSALPFFLGMAMGRKNDVTIETPKEMSRPNVQANSNAYAKFAADFKNS